MRAVVVVTLCSMLQGCFFFYIPGELKTTVQDTITGDKGAHCVATNAALGDSIRVPGGRMGTVVGLYGTSYRCTEKLYPIRADLVFTS
ncbi:MAG: hypothetical protein Q7T97_02355 [Burkholderiaceae bacterium]|nr:hypothetical protein [Burkholderiaceae bacterium]